ncbi:hypothetical protein ERX46_10760 [Brumimicrobium glaciale]|uniref:Uncharacterized protein n=1 Tax=Brumimicrobium glaciale TaxID=200475 RepID=A0A4Q4KJA4_9FLAO|nr:hypothetical protein [Brumimicrobium glaciale]RYM33413.1 hypothetical protein ERX46_10760 [Brumimicrobium glaciale]
MKNKMEDFIKNIIVEKRFFKLTPKEKSILKEWAENEEEFDALKLTFLSVSSFNQEKQAELSPSVKKRLNDRFAAKHVHQKEMWMNKLWLFFFPRDTQFFKKPAFQLVMVALTVALVIPFLWQNQAPQYAMNTAVEKLDPITIGLDTVESLESEAQSKELSQENSDQKAVELSDEFREPQISSIVEERFVETTIGPLPNPAAKEMNQNFNLEESKIDWDNGKNDDDIVASPSAKRTQSDFRLDNVEVMSPAGKNMDTKFSKAAPKFVDVDETMGLLMALY